MEPQIAQRVGTSKAVQQSEGKGHHRAALPEEWAQIVKRCQHRRGGRVNEHNRGRKDSG